VLHVHRVTFKSLQSATLLKKRRAVPDGLVVEDARSNGDGGH
jgi:hypothetical protein